MMLEPPGAMITEPPFRLPSGGRKTVRNGLSSGPLPRRQRHLPRFPQRDIVVRGRLLARLIAASFPSSGRLLGGQEVCRRYQVAADAIAAGENRRQQPCRTVSALGSPSSSGTRRRVFSGISWTSSRRAFFAAVFFGRGGRRQHRFHLGANVLLDTGFLQKRVASFVLAPGSFRPCR